MELLIAFYGFFGLFAGVVLGAQLGRQARERFARDCADRQIAEYNELRRRFDIDLGIEYGKGWNAYADFVQARVLSALSLPRMPEQSSPNDEVGRDHDTTLYQPHG